LCGGGGDARIQPRGRNFFSNKARKEQLHNAARGASFVAEGKGKRTDRRSSPQKNMAVPSITLKRGSQIKFIPKKGDLFSPRRRGRRRGELQRLEMDPKFITGFVEGGGKPITRF